MIHRISMIKTRESFRSLWRITKETHFHYDRMIVHRNVQQPVTAVWNITHGEHPYHEQLRNDCK